MDRKSMYWNFIFLLQNYKNQSTAPDHERAVIKTSYKVIGRNDVTGPRDVKITHFPRSPWRCAVASESETRQSAAWVDRFLFLGISGLFPGLSLSHCFFLSFFWDWEVSVSFFVSLLFLFVLVHGHFCSVVVGFSISHPRFPSSQYVIPSEKYTSMTSVDCRVISSLHVQFDEMKVRLWHSYVRIQASDGCKSAFEVAPLLEGSKPTAHRSSDVGGREAGIHAHEWKQQEASLPHCRFEKSRQASPSLWTDKANSPCVCRFALASNDHSISDGETELETFQGDTHIANRKDQATEY